MLVVFSSSVLNAQCTADAGEHQAMCVNFWGEFDTINLGGIPSAFNGTPPYQYVWETNFYSLTGNLHTASLLLNDTTLANPFLGPINSSSITELTVKLTVTDSNNNVCVDSVTINFPKFTQTNADVYATIDAGDTIVLSSQIYGDSPPFSYHWESAWRCSFTLPRSRYLCT